MKSIEIRWFLNEPETRKIALDWFQKIGGKLDNPEVRTDFYLPRTFGSLLGVKLRNYDNEPNVEIKEKLGTIEVPEANGFGIIEKWKKWSFKLIEADKTAEPIISEKVKWVKIEKSRSMIKYQILPDNTEKIIPAKDKVDSACNVEITDIKIGGKSLWTLGFEAFREDDDEQKILENFKMIYSKYMTKELLTVLKPENSYSYPKLIESN